MVASREAIIRGMDDARAAGRVPGRPRSLKDTQVEALLRAGWTTDRVRKALKVGSSVISRVRNNMRG